MKAPSYFKVNVSGLKLNFYLVWMINWFEYLHSLSTYIFHNGVTFGTQKKFSKLPEFSSTYSASFALFIQILYKTHGSK